MTVLAMAVGDSWSALVADSIKGRSTHEGEPRFDVRTDKLTRIGDCYISAVGAEVVIHAAQVLATWQEPKALAMDEPLTFDAILSTANKMRRLHIAKGGRIPAQGATLAFCSPSAAKFWRATISGDELRRQGPVPSLVPVGRAIVVYGGQEVWFDAPASAKVAIEHLVRVICQVDNDARKLGKYKPLPYLLAEWSSVLFSDGEEPIRRRPFTTVDELLENELEATPEILSAMP